MSARVATPFDGLLGVPVPQSALNAKGRRVITGWLVACRAEAIHLRPSATESGHFAPERPEVVSSSGRETHHTAAPKQAKFADTAAINREIKQAEARCWAELAAKDWRKPTKRQSCGQPANPPRNG
jgi:hypothetical protein